MEEDNKTTQNNVDKSQKYSKDYYNNSYYGQ